MKKLIAPLAAASLAVVFILGMKVGEARIQSRWDASINSQTREDHQVLLLGLKDSFETGQKHEEVREVIRYETKTLIEQIPVFMAPDVTCPILPDGFGLLFNASAEGANATVSGSKPDGQGSTAPHGQ